jgi:hypothetical protein
MANGIEDLNTDLLPDSEGIKDIIITKGKDIADTKVLDTIRSLDKTGQLANIITKDDISEIREGVMTGDMQRIKDTLQFNYDKLEALSPAIVANALGYSGNPIGQGLAVGNLANEIGQILASGSEMAAKSDFGDNIFANTLERGIGAINVPIQIGTDVFDRGITAATNQYNNVMNPVLDQFGRVVRFPFQYGRNFFRNQFMDEPIRPKPKPPVPQSFIDRQEEESRPVFTPPPATSNEAEVDYGGSGGGSGGSYGGGEDFGSPFAPSPSPPRGPDLRFRANGGLVAVSRYLKGR